MASINKIHVAISAYRTEHWVTPHPAMCVAFNIRLIWTLDTILRGSASLFDIPVQCLVSILAKICKVFENKNWGNLYPLIPKYLYVDENMS